MRCRPSLAADLYKSPYCERDYPRVQVLTVANVLHGAEIKMPLGVGDVQAGAQGGSV